MANSGSLFQRVAKIEWATPENRKAFMCEGGAVAGRGQAADNSSTLLYLNSFIPASLSRSDCSSFGLRGTMRNAEVEEFRENESCTAASQCVTVGAETRIRAVPPRLCPSLLELELRLSF